MFWGIRGDITDELIADTQLKQIISVPADDLDDLSRLLAKGTLELFINPQVSDLELEKELALSQKTLFRLIRLTPMVLILLIGLFSIHVDNYWWLCLSLSIYVVYKFHFYLLPFQKLINYGLFGLLLIATFLVRDWAFALIITTVLLSYIWSCQLELFRQNQVLKTSLSSEHKFIEFYFRNVILLVRNHEILNSPQEVYSFLEYSQQNTPSQLSEHDRLFFCKQCKNRSFSKQIGIVCGLTSNKPSFKYDCPDFLLDESVEERVLIEYNKRYEAFEESSIAVKAAPQAMNTLAITFILADFYHYVTGQFPLILSSGISNWLVEVETYQFGMSLIIPFIFLSLALIANLGYRWPYLIGLALYAIDAAFCFIYKPDLLSWHAHLIVLGILIYSFRNISDRQLFSGRLLTSGALAKKVYQINQQYEADQNTTESP